MFIEKVVKTEAMPRSSIHIIGASKVRQQII